MLEKRDQTHYNGGDTPTPAFDSKERDEAPMELRLTSLLIVDDQLEVRRSIAEMIRALNLGIETIYEANSSEEAIALYNRHRPSMALVDVVLFGASGFDVLRHIRSVSRETVVVVMTAFPQLDYALQAIKGRVDAFMVKPVTREKLEQTFFDLFDQARADGNGDQARAFYLRQMDQFMRQKLLTGENLERARVGSGFAALRGDRLMLALVTGDNPIPEPALRESERLLARAGQPCLLYGRDGRTAVCLCAFSTAQAQAQCLLSFETAVRTHLPGRLSALAVADRSVGLQALHQRASFALDYAVDNGCADVPVLYERMDLALILANRCHGALIAAYDQASAALFQDALDSLFIHLRQQDVPVEAMLRELNALCALEGLSPVAAQAESLDALHLALLAHFDRYLAKGRADAASARITALRRQLMAGLSGTLSRDQLARAAGLSYGYIGDLFRQRTGMSINDYFRALRLRKAAELLGSTGLKVYAVATLTGFQGNKHFYSLFQDVYGLTPVQYHTQRYGAGGGA